MFAIVGPPIETLRELRADPSVGYMDRVKALSALPYAAHFEGDSLAGVMASWQAEELYRDDGCLYTPVILQGEHLAQIVTDESWVPDEFKLREGDKKRWREHEHNFKRLTNPSDQADNYAMVKMLMNGRYRGVICSVYYPDDKAKQQGEVILRPEWVHLTEHDKRRLQPAHDSMRTVEKSDVDNYHGDKSPVAPNEETGNIVLLDGYKKS